MKKRDLYLDRIYIDERYSMQVDPNNNENLLIYDDKEVVLEFSLNRRIHTLFKELQKLIQSEEVVGSGMYGRAIHIKDHLFMKANDRYEVDTVDFYTQDAEGNQNVIYITKTSYMTQKLFHRILIPIEMLNDPEYQNKNPNVFKEMIDLLQMIHI